MQWVRVTAYARLYSARMKASYMQLRLICNEKRGDNEEQIHYCVSDEALANVSGLLFMSHWHQHIPDMAA